MSSEFGDCLVNCLEDCNPHMCGRSFLDLFRNRLEHSKDQDRRSLRRLIRKSMFRDVQYLHVLIAIRKRIADST